MNDSLHNKEQKDIFDLYLPTAFTQTIFTLVSLTDGQRRLPDPVMYVCLWNQYFTCSSIIFKPTDFLAGVLV